MSYLLLSGFSFIRLVCAAAGQKGTILNSKLFKNNVFTVFAESQNALFTVPNPGVSDM